MRPFIPIRVLFSLAMVSPLLLAGEPAVADGRTPEREAALESLAGLSIPFVVNTGQTDPKVAFYAQTFAGTVFVTREGKIVYSLPAERSGPGAGGWALSESFVGGRPRPAPGRPALTRVSYFLGADPTQWKTGVATHDAVNLGEVWEAITVSLRAHGDNVEKLFTVHPGGEASRIRVRVGGAKALRIGEASSLVAVTGLGEIAFSAPVAYQESNGRRHTVAVAYALAGDEYGFRLGAHDTSLPVVIDPILQSTYLGGSGFDEGLALAIHPTSGEIYVAGDTNSTNFPGTAGGAQPALGGGVQDAFVARLNPTLTTLNQATYLGGAGVDIARTLAIHPTSGEIYVAGDTSSVNFPGTAGGAQPAIGTGSPDAFAARLNASLTTLIQATYVGGTGADQGFALAIHPTSGEIYVAGGTTSGIFPGTAGGAQPANAGSPDAFLARLNASLTTLIQATFLGGSGTDRGQALVIHPTSGEVYVAGLTSSTNLPGTAGGAQAANAGGFGDAFVARLNATLTALNQATYLGGSSDLEEAFALAIHPTSGEVYVAGVTGSTNFPGTSGGAQAVFGGIDDAFVARLNAALTTLVQATYLGGSGQCLGFALAIHPTSGEVYVAGRAASADFPGTTGGAQPATGGGGEDAFAARLNAALTTLNQATYLGGGGGDQGFALAIHPTSGEVYVAGGTSSANFPGTAGGAQEVNGDSTAFVARLTADLAGAAGPTPTFTPTVTPTPTPIVTGPTATPSPTPTIQLPTATSTPVPGGPPVEVPTLSPGMLVALALGLAAVALLMLKRFGQ